MGNCYILNLAQRFKNRMTDNQCGPGEARVTSTPTNIFFKILRRFFNLSLFIKIGAIIGLCFFGYILLAGYFFVQLKFIKGEINQLENFYLPHYKVGQIALRELTDINGRMTLLFNLPDDFNLTDWKNTHVSTSLEIKNGIQTLRAILDGGLIRDVTGPSKSAIDEFTVLPLADDSKDRTFIIKAIEDFKEIEKIRETLLDREHLAQDQIEALKEEYSKALKKAYHNLASFIRFSSNKRIIHANEIEQMIEKDYISIVLVAVVLVGILATTAYLFIQMVLNPIKEITYSIHKLATGFEQCPDKILEVKSADEIGQLSQEFNNLLRMVTEFNMFKKIIEEDETVEDIYKRLANVFKERLGLNTFAIFQVSDNENKIKPVFLSPPDLEFNQEKLYDANKCRAKRTGHIVSSISYKGICKLFLWKDEVDHICIPMIVGGRTVGVVQFLIPASTRSKQLHNIDFAIRQAQNYIREALPVIEAKRFAQSLKEMTLKDPLTNLYNRRFMESYIDTIVSGVIRRGTLLSILMCDLDYFKEVNDTYGHEIGDVILRKTAQVLKENVRASDLVIRFGGEEFLVLLIDTDQDMAVKIAEKLRSKVESTKFKVPGGYIHKTISIGISEFPVDADGVWEVIKYADVALYAAKSDGRNRVVRFKPEMWKDDNY